MMLKFFSLDVARKIVVLLTAFALGCIVTWEYFPRIKTVEVTSTEYVKVPVAVQEKHETQISYVPKETVPAAVTGTGQAEREDTDVEIKNQPAAIHVKVNDQKYSFAPLPEEKYKFDKGKLLVEQSSAVDLNLKIPIQTVDKTKRNAIGYGYNSRHEEELTLRHRFSGRWGVYIRGEGDIFKHVSGHGKGLRSCGAGVEFYF